MKSEVRGRRSEVGAKSHFAVAVKYCMEVATRGVNGRNVAVWGSLPFAPPPDIWLQVLKDDDFRQVDSVYWDGKEFLVFFLCEENTKLTQLLNYGWRLDD